MITPASDLIVFCKNWLKMDVFPLWIKNGIDLHTGSFYESLAADGSAICGPRRALVQCRQIYAFTEAYKMQLIEKPQAVLIVSRALQFLDQFYKKPNGSYRHAVVGSGEVSESQSELYTQAFVLFALARAYELLKTQSIKVSALQLLQFLYSERKLAAGGFTEIKNNVLLFQSNPHMHLFEAAIEWIKVDPAAEWKKLGLELFTLSTNHFTDPKTGFLAEHFTENWKPCIENSHFIVEPGHQYEWSWLFLQYEKCASVSAGALPYKLFQLAEKNGVHKTMKLVFDEITSSGKIKKGTSRFWPQCERIKAAIELGLGSTDHERLQFALIADEALVALKRYLNTTTPGLWFDTILENGLFTDATYKASSLYHIVNAMSEYCAKRPLLQLGNLQK